MLGNKVVNEKKKVYHNVTLKSQEFFFSNKHKDTILISPNDLSKPL